MFRYSPSFFPTLTPVHPVYARALQHLMRSSPHLTSYSRSLRMWLLNERGRYPRKIQKLFAPRLPFQYKKPIDYPPEQRRTTPITPVSLWKSEIDKYKAEHPPVAPKEQIQISKKKLHEESQRRQFTAWEDTELFEQNEFLKDPYKTVFVARLPYSMTELDLPAMFNHFGAIESIRVIRNSKNGQSRGYGFIVFEREQDAKNCIRELAPTGLPVDNSVRARKILVDMERGRLVRSWKPRRLGGGLGGRHYTLVTAPPSRHASAAASGRRMNLSTNPYQQNQQSPAFGRFHKRPAPDRSAPPAKRHAPTPNYGSAYGGSSAIPPASDRTPQSIRDKYAKYQRTSDRQSRDSADSNRSIRSIRRGE